MHLLLSETIFLPSPLDGRNFFVGGSVDLFWNHPVLLLLQHLPSEYLYISALLESHHMGQLFVYDTT
jgi:hypothetical protein